MVYNIIQINASILSQIGKFNRCWFMFWCISLLIVSYSLPIRFIVYRIFAFLFTILIIYITMIKSTVTLSIQYMRTFSSRASLGGNYPKANASYEITKTTVTTASHEQCQVNPIIQTGKRTFQHSSYTRTTCVRPECETKLCKKPCDQEDQKDNVGHGTHNPTLSSARYASSVDFSGAPKTQYQVPYNKPIPVENELIPDKETTDRLNNDQTHLGNVHQYAMHKARARKTETALHENNASNYDENIN